MKVIPIAASDYDLKCTRQACVNTATCLVQRRTTYPMCDEHRAQEQFIAESEYEETTVMLPVIIHIYSASTPSDDLLNSSNTDNG